MKRRIFGGVTVALCTATALAVAPTSGFAAQGNAHQAGAQDRAANAADDLVAAKPGQFKLGKSDKALRGKVITSHGLQYVPYERTYHGLPVVGGDFVVVTNSAGKVLSTSVAQNRQVKLSASALSANVTKGAAVKTAKALVKGAKVEGTRQVVLQRGGSNLAWETTVDGTRKGKPSRLTVYVSSQSGKVLHTVEHVANGDGDAAWSGPDPVHIDTTSSGGTYSMTTPDATSLTCGENSAYTGSDDKWGDGDATNLETGCVDALYSAQQEKGMLSDWLSRDGMDGNGGWVPIHVGLDDENAYYDGNQVAVGHNTAGESIGSIDVVAHEFGHGVDDHTPGSISGNGTQEFVADTFGASTEWYDNQGADYDKPDFTVGEQINLTGDGPIRNMYDPSKLGHDNCYSDSVPTEEVHAAAGPGNHWFYLLAEGNKPTNGQPESPTCNNSSVTGVGVQKAITIMYNAMLQKTSGASYLKYRTWTMQAAKDVYGADECNAVKAAWDAVSVPKQSDEPSCS